jgi:hypothetical protein
VAVFFVGVTFFAAFVGAFTVTFLTEAFFRAGTPKTSLAEILAAVCSGGAQAWFGVLERICGFADSGLPPTAGQSACYTARCFRGARQGVPGTLQADAVKTAQEEGYDLAADNVAIQR